MKLKFKIKRLIEELTGFRIYKLLPRGIDVFQDIRRYLPSLEINTVFDVGANTGQSARTYLVRFPSSDIYSFEPASSTFGKLQNNLKGDNRVHCFKFALGASNRKGKLLLEGGSEMYILLKQTDEDLSVTNNNTETVDIITLDDFCLNHGITAINFLKIDTEGEDLEVLKGSLNSIREQKIDVIQVETGMNPGNERHVPLETIKNFLEAYNYFIFGIYEQVNEWPTGNPHLRRTNSVFISSRIIEMNRKSSDLT